MTRGRFLKRTVPAAVLAPLKTLGFKRDLERFHDGQVLTAERLNEIVKEINRR